MVLYLIPDALRLVSGVLSDAARSHQRRGTPFRLLTAVYHFQQSGREAFDVPTLAEDALFHLRLYGV